MGWASYHIEKLLKGETVSFRPHGSSMTPRIHSGQLCTVEPMTKHPTLGIDVREGDVVLCKVCGREFLHLVSAIRDHQVQISNNHGHVNGWIGFGAIFGRLVSVAD